MYVSFFFFCVMCYEASRSLLNLWTMNIQNDGLLIKRKNGVWFSKQKQKKKKELAPRGRCLYHAHEPNHSSCDTAPYGGKPKKWEPLKPLFVHFILAKAINVYICTSFWFIGFAGLEKKKQTKKTKPHPWGSLNCYYPAALPRNPCWLFRSEIS